MHTRRVTNRSPSALRCHHTVREQRIRYETGWWLGYLTISGLGTLTALKITSNFAGDCSVIYSTAYSNNARVMYGTLLMVLHGGDELRPYSTAHFSMSPKKSKSKSKGKTVRAGSEVRGMLRNASYRSRACTSTVQYSHGHHHLPRATNYKAWQATSYTYAACTSAWDRSRLFALTP